MSEEKKNSYDRDDIVRRHFTLLANDLKFAAYTVRDVVAQAHGVERWSSMQYHVTQGNTVIATLTGPQVEFLAETLETMEGRELPFNRYDVVCGAIIQVYERPEREDGRRSLEFAFLSSSGNVLALLQGRSTAELFVTTWKRCEESAASS